VSPASIPIASEITVNPHNQTLAIAIQLGVIGTLALWAMWIGHFLLFRSGGITAWLGTVIVVDNVVCSTVHSHLFDFNNGWLYVLGVGVLGATVLQESARTLAKPALSRETVHPGSNPSVLKRLSCPPVDWKG
jgi:O-antigen ligase